MVCALTSMLISTEGGLVCCVRLCGARGFSKDRSLMYCALTISCCAAPGTAQQLIVNAQYIKDLSFENPRAPQSLTQQTSPPSVEINIDVKAQTIGPENYEVVLTMKASAKSQNDTLFLIELTYGAVVTVRNVSQELMPQVV